MNKIVYTAVSKRNFYAREQISAFVLSKNFAPVNPFMNFGYFLGDMAPREKIRKANNLIIRGCDELWQFGEISNGCYFEILLAMGNGKKIRFFTVSGKKAEIKEILDVSELEFEEELREEIDVERLRGKIEKYLNE